ncbi:monooxygenase [Streptomyces sp. NPDC002574]|uniref:FAD binding domain-containing protein n=1 Tax=Streptomyces sp. NPDC002574 TaxID=3364652 RepID=UPI00368744CA
MAAAHELRAVGADVAVYERSVGRTPARGAGVVVQPEIEALLNRLAVPAEAIGVELHERQELDVRGTATRHEAPQLMTAWDALYRALREPLADVCHRLDGSLRRVQVEGHEVTAEFSDGHTAHGNFLVGADGIGSATRRLLDPSSRPAYAGYVAWRGLEPESRLSGELLDLFAGRLTLFTSSGMQMLCSLVPGPGGELEKGSRRVNWVWYVNVAEQDLPGLLTGRSGKRFAHFLPPGEALPETVERVLRQAEASLPPAFAELARLSDLFMQPVLDLPPWRMVADHAALIGDAAGTVRPQSPAGRPRRSVTPRPWPPPCSGGPRRSRCPPSHWSTGRCGASTTWSRCPGRAGSRRRRQRWVMGWGTPSSRPPPCRDFADSEIHHDRAFYRATGPAM